MVGRTLLDRVRLMLFGDRERKGMIALLILYLVLADIAFMYLTPFLYMLSTMFKTTADLLDPTVKWIPSAFQSDNLKLAWQGLRFPEALQNSLIIAGLSAVGQVVFCSIAGYAFARLKFPGKNILFALLVFSFLIPPQTLIIPLYVLFKNLGLLGTHWGVILPAMLGHGIRGALFVIIFRQFFMTLPRELEDAALIDGAGPFRVYWRVMIPLAKPAILVVFLFSFVWHWNETFVTGMMLGGKDLPLSLSLFNLNKVLSGLYPDAEAGFDLNETIRMAASFLIIMPPLLVYMLAQRWFVEGVERTGLVE
ncbi:carbohydrate ABC transporter permease [Paenibacillus contaminans]|uniref:Carbohydrate ABC transporter permease n=1 Tax=Paenibacillus contaminans TaxID=450362 RepID=A0A329MHW9_9BACL|nr:carbohydrate ABC transporter permease [Paenibacillus contaminans]RAV19429.1 carbohydrate ABC transporter permease [Paenibacillus contaminans]